VGKRTSSSESPHSSRDSPTPSTSQRTSRTKPIPTGADVRFICEKEGTNLYQASTMQLDAKVRRWAVEQGNKNLIAKLTAGDMIALKKNITKVVSQICITNQGFSNGILATLIHWNYVSPLPMLN